MSLLARIRFRLRWWWWFWQSPPIGRYYARHGSVVDASNAWRAAQREWREREPKP